MRFQWPLTFASLRCLPSKIFEGEQVDVAILEVGLGGEYDATNVVLFFFWVSRPVFGSCIGARLYTDSRWVGPHSGGSAPYQEFFHTQSSNSRPLVKGGAAPSATPYPLVIIMY